jgi:hypothetical protein
MALMMGRLYAALRAADVPDDKATAAAEEVAGFENRLATIESTLRLLIWISSFNTAMAIAILAKLFLPGN